MYIKYLSSFIAILTISLLSSCSVMPKTMTELCSKELLEKGNKAIVFLNISEENQAPSILSSKIESVPYILKKIGNSKSEYEINPQIRPFQSNIYDYGKDFLILEPGIYYIDYITLLRRYEKDYKVESWLPSPGIKNWVVMYGAFEVKAGDVIKLGNLRIKNNQFSHIDDSDILEKQLEKHKRYELLERVKQGTFYPRGSLIRSDNNGKIILIHADKLTKQRNNLINNFIENHK